MGFLLTLSKGARRKNLKNHWTRRWRSIVLIFIFLCPFVSKQLKQISRIVLYSIDEYMLDYMLKQISRIALYSVDEYIKNYVINSILGRNSLRIWCYSLIPAQRILLQMLQTIETCLSQTYKNVKPKRVLK